MDEAARCEQLILMRDGVRRVSHCPGHGCGWLFLDVSGRRRWWSMSTCGSREKMRRLHHRHTQLTD
jgi:predicted RNA-binding Zn ribbon-like protein